MRRNRFDLKEVKSSPVAPKRSRRRRSGGFAVGVTTVLTWLFTLALGGSVVAKAGCRVCPARYRRPRLQQLLRPAVSP